MYYEFNDNINLYYLGKELIINDTEQTILLNSFQTLIVEDVIQTGEIRNSIKKIANISKVTEYEVSIFSEKFIVELQKRGYISKTIVEKKGKSTVKIYGEKGKYYPIKLTLELTDKCNLCCEHCFKESSAIKNNNIPYEELIIFLNSMIGKVREVQLTGGEPMLYRKFKELVIYLKKNFEIITLTTTATKINKKNINIIKMIDYVQVSLYSHIPDEHNKITGNSSSFKLTLKGIKILADYDIKFSVANVLRKSFMKKLDNYILFLMNNKVKEINFGEVGLVGRGRYLSDDWYFDKKQLEDLAEKIKELKNRHKKKININSWEEEKMLTVLGQNRLLCGAGLLEWTVNEKGIIKPCVLFPDNKFDKINIKNYKEYFKFDQKEYINKELEEWEKELNSVGLSTVRICSVIYNSIKEKKYEENII